MKKVRRNVRPSRRMGSLELNILRGLKNQKVKGWKHGRKFSKILAMYDQGC